MESIKVDGIKELYKLVGKYESKNRVANFPVDSQDFYMLLEIVVALALTKENKS